MNIERYIRKLIANSTGKTVVAVDGYSGAGKTSILRRLAKANKAIQPVYLDDFMNTGKKRRALLKAARDKVSVMELQWKNVKKIRQLIGAYRTRNGLYAMKLYNPKTDHYDQRRTFNLSKRALVLEGIFIFNSKMYQNLFDIRIFLDVDTKIADDRRIKREKRRWGKEYVSEDRPDSFMRLFKLAYNRYVRKYQPKKIADLVVKVY